MWILLELTWADAGDWLRDHGLPVIGAIVVALVASEVIRRVVPHALRPAVARQMADSPQVEVDRRLETLSGVIVRTSQIVLFALALLTVLPELGFDIRPVLAGVGITGIALGLGAQSLVRDTINGIFILSENQYAKGDVVTVAGHTGTVEDVTLRRTVLRDLDGVLHSVPNSAVVVASNHTRNFSRVRVTLPVHVTSDLAKVREIVDRAGSELAGDPEFRDVITEAPRFMRVEGIDANGLSIHVGGAVAPGKQWEVAGALRARLLEALQAGGVKTPWG